MREYLYCGKRADNGEWVENVEIIGNIHDNPDLLLD